MSKAGQTKRVLDLVLGCQSDHFIGGLGRPREKIIARSVNSSKSNGPGAVGITKLLYKTLR